MYYFLLPRMRFVGGDLLGNSSRKMISAPTVAYIIHTDASNQGGENMMRTKPLMAYGLIL